MKLNGALAFASFLIVGAWSGAVAQETAVAVPALTPEVQTAEWAVQWWGSRHEQKLKELAEMQKVDLLMVGDSITHGWESAGKKVWDQYYAHRNAFNIGFSGDRTEQVLWRFENGEIEGISPKAAVVMIGTNNTGHRQDDPDETAAGVKAILDKLNAKSPDTKILLLAIFPRGESPDDKLRKINDAINERIREFADGNNIVYLDISDKFLAEDGTLPKEIMPDRLHPNPRGYAIWAEAIEPTLAKLMGDEVVAPSPSE
ncbi:beta-glucosidase [Rhodopirellula rubra]|uniref:Beta-glucosidase n=1 Tax=Aporhodopirellula rubra TaxID=980271 RepID=A0A7W5E5V1_9BACT|nr:platelet-activating factor acetylhydrolase IB subunit [Aporhodopirellula rubra]MBB3210088.1 beta-glucosidase [Aporhodopirellula rubra]